VREASVAPNRRIFSDIHQGDFLAVGLACVAAAWLVGELGWDRRLGTSSRT
jgi:F0F1-type ATP synthase membrane subunit c/vacuolar-type H+-ATPase subunit K